MEKKILMIDDNEDMHLLVGHILKRAGFDILSAMNGNDGLKMVLEHQPDLVILDYMMPQKNGPAVFSEFINDEKYKSVRHIPFIMLTAKQTNDADVNKMIEMGMTAFLYKPFGQNELINVIHNILAAQRIQIKRQNLFEAINDAKEFLSNLIENIPNALFIIDNDGIITFYNGGHLDVLGYSGNQLLNQPFLSIVYPAEDNLRNAKILLDARNKISHQNVNLVSSDDRSVPFRISNSPLRSDGGNGSGLILIGSDISEIKHLENLLIEKEKLATFTETAIAVNHEINNPLMPILGNLQLLLADKKQFDIQTVQRLEAIYRNALRIQEITKKLRKIRQPVQKPYLGDTKMLDIHESV